MVLNYRAMGIGANYKFLLSIGTLLAAFTCCLSGFTTWFLWKDVYMIPLWGTTSAATHHLLSSFFHSFILAWIATWATRRAIKNKKLIPVHWHLKSQTLIDRLPGNNLHRSFMLGLTGSLMAVISIMLFDMQNVIAVSRTEYIIFKSIFGALLAAAVSAVTVYRAMGDKKLQQQKL